MKADSDKAAQDVNELSPSIVGELISGLDGVGSLEVDLRADGSPRVRVRLDGSVPGPEVSRQIRDVLGTAAPAAVGERPVGQKRAGLGRGLSDILAADSGAIPPTLFEPVPAEVAPDRVGLALVAVEETVGGISVRAADSAGGVAFSPVEDSRSLNQAVVSAIGRLRDERPLPRLVGVEIRDVDGAAVLTVVLAVGDGRRSVGAALVEGGMPFTLGKAVWEALAAFD